MLAKQNRYIESAYKKLQIISQDKEKRLEYEAREKAIRDYNQSMYEAEQRGIEIGEQRGIETGIKNMAKTYQKFVVVFQFFKLFFLIIRFTQEFGNKRKIGLELFSLSFRQFCKTYQIQPVVLNIFTDSIVFGETDFICREYICHRALEDRPVFFKIAYVPGSDILDTPTNTSEILYHVGQSTIPDAGKPKMRWNVRTALAVAFP